MKTPPFAENSTKATDAKTDKVPESYIDAFKMDECIECGECLYSCKYMDLSEASAITAIKNLRRGVDCDQYLDKCTFCAQCND